MAGHDETPEKSAELTAHLTTVASAVVTLHGPKAASKIRRIEESKAAIRDRRLPACGRPPALCFLSFLFASSILRFFDVDRGVRLSSSVSIVVD
jgi:hypothetical protein